MHPFEQLRMVARATGEDPGLLAQEAAGALAGLQGDGAALVTACRRLVERQPSCGPLWWLGARVLAAADPAQEALAVAEELDADCTVAALVRALPEDARVVVVGWPGQVGNALRARWDAEVLVVDALGEGSGLVSRLRRAGQGGRERRAGQGGRERGVGPSGRERGAAMAGGGAPGAAVPVSLVPESGLGQAVAASDLVLLEATALGESGLVATAGSRAAAAVACDAGVAVWAVAGVGRVLPGALWEALRAAVLESAPGDGDSDVVPARLVDRVVGPDGVATYESVLDRADYPSVPELTRRAPGRVGRPVGPAPGSAARR